MNIDTIDLNQAEQAVSSLTSNKRQGYQPKTLQEHNNTRRVYLPLFPSISFGPKNCLLLTNVSVTRLGPDEITRRQHGAYTSDALMMMNNYSYSDSPFNLSREDAEQMAARLHVGLSIITFNANLLRGICRTLLLSYKSFRRHVLHQRDTTLRYATLNSKQMVIALEFFLQIDVDIFYMKTCSFRGAEPATNIQGLFCENNEPETRYSLLPCGNQFCRCCHPLNHTKKTQAWPVVDFNSSARHQFVNGYTTYLNCPATCTTSNIIYTMTCPCGHFDYVDSTAKTLADAMSYHREHGNRIIHETLVGSPLFRGAIRDPNENEKEIANRMRLYQHSARCPSALRSFLDVNPVYYCFVPLLFHEALAENMAHYHGYHHADPQETSIIMMGAIDNQRVARYLDYVPIPPEDYVFSYEQRQKQRLFFQQFVLSTIHQPPYSTLDLYRVMVIAVLPDDCSKILRYIIETLFIIHSESKLNMICPIGGDAEKRYGSVYDHVWCTNLNRPFVIPEIPTHQA